MADQNLENILEKRKQTQQIMKEMDIPVWITITADNAAEQAHLPLIGAPPGAAPRAYILTPEKAIAISHILEAEGQEKHGFETIPIKGYDIIKPLAEKLEMIMGKHIVAPIALNYSYKYHNVDTLGKGATDRLRRALNKSYFPKDCDGQKFSSADELIYRAASTKLPYEIELLKRAAEVTNSVLEEGFKCIKPEMTEKDVAKVFHTITSRRIKYYAEHHDPTFTCGYSWPKAFNPIVLTGEGIAGSPHLPPSDRVIERGSTVYVDFGISVRGYHGDLQHFGYILEEGETKAPDNIQEMFDILIESIHEGMAAAIPGAKGWEVDKASRDIILAADYPSFQHGTGHQLGIGNTHAPGVSFGSRYAGYTNENPAEGKNPYSQSEILENYVMTIEPRIQVKDGASIEVDGVITKKGFEPFVPIQKEIHLIG